MFDEFTARKPVSRPRFALAASVVFHVLLLAWILHPPTALILAPSSVRFGVNGGSKSGALTTIYFAAHANQAATNQLAESIQSRRMAPNAALNWHPRNPIKARRHADADADAVASNAMIPQVSAPAGSELGSTVGGSMSGPDIRPALPIVSLDPTVPSSELAGIDGDVVVEITIDDKGNIVDKTVVKSLSASIDQRVMAALESWRFRPAMRDGTAIPSKQDVFYHFKGAS